MIKSLLDTDFYILTMQQAIFHQYTNVDTKFTFKWRNWKNMGLNIKIGDFVKLLKERLDALCELRMTKSDLEFLSKVPFFKPDYIEYLRLFQLNRNYIHPYVKYGCLAIDIAGPLLNVIPFEVPVLATVSQLYTENQNQMAFNWNKIGREYLQEKMAYLDAHVSKLPFTFADFGTRRRAHVDWHREVLTYIMDHYHKYLSGTSNVMFAKELDLQYIGTMAHLWFQVHQQLTHRLIDSQKAALQAWADEYRGELGIALSDTLGFKVFLCDFDRYFSLLFDGCRQDSGDPWLWAEELIAHYKKMRIDPTTKTAIFSDGLTFPAAVDLFKTFHTQIKTGFGIGTYLTNDCGFLAPQIVIKNTETNGRPTAKISDSTGKGMCLDDDFQAYLNKVIKEKTDACYA